MYGLSDLPSELLCLTSKKLGNKELLVLCQVSKQLHFAALTVYFGRFAGVYAPTHAAADICQPSLAALQGLLLALWVKECNSICITVTSYQQLSCFIRFVSKLEPFRSLHLCFGPGMEPYTRPIIFELIDLMLVIKQKGCEDMFVTGGHTERAWVPNVIELNRALRLEGMVSTVDTIGRFVRKLFRRHRRDETYWITVTPSLTTLKTVTLSTDYFFTPFMSTWTIRTLNDSSITSLTLDIRFRNAPRWIHILPMLRLRHLQNFVIFSNTLSLQCLTQFLRRHNGITSLSTKGLSLDDKETYDKSVLNLNALPKLRTLAGLPNDIKHILHLQPAFKSLKHITISDPDDDGYISSLNDCLDAMAARDKIYVTSIAINTDHTSWLLSQRKADKERSMPHITSLTIVWMGQKDELPSPSFTAALAGWLALFPTLEHLHWGVKQHLEGSQAERKIASVIIEHCPQLKTLELLRGPPVLNRQPPPVDAWLKDGPSAVQQLVWSQDIERNVASCSCRGKARG